MAKILRLFLMAVVLPLTLVMINLPSYISAEPPDVTVSISPKSTEKSFGQEFTVDVTVTTVTDLNTFSFKVDYDSSIIQVPGEEGDAGVIAGQITDNSVNPPSVKSIPITWNFDPSGTQGTIVVTGNLNAAPVKGPTGPDPLPGYVLQSSALTDKPALLRPRT